MATIEDVLATAGNKEAPKPTSVPRHDGVPSGVTLPHALIEGPLTWPGQHGGFLGPRFDPLLVTQDPNSPAFRMDTLALADRLLAIHDGLARVLADYAPAEAAVEQEDGDLVGAGVVLPLGADEFVAQGKIAAGRLHHLLQAAFDELVEVVERDLDAVVGDAIFFVVVGTNFLTAAALAHLCAAFGRHLRFVFFLLALQQAGAQHLHIPLIS